MPSKLIERYLYFQVLLHAMDHGLTALLEIAATKKYKNKMGMHFFAVPTIILASYGSTWTQRGSLEAAASKTLEGDVMCGKNIQSP
jgi:hypothetical protein